MNPLTRTEIDVGRQLLHICGHQMATILNWPHSFSFFEAAADQQPSASLYSIAIQTESAFLVFGQLLVFVSFSRTSRSLPHFETHT